MELLPPKNGCFLTRPKPRKRWVLFETNKDFSKGNKEKCEIWKKQNRTIFDVTFLIHCSEKLFFVVVPFCGKWSVTVVKVQFSEFTKKLIFLFPYMTIRKTNSIKIHKSDTSLVSKLFSVFFKNFWDVVILIYGTIFLWWFLCPYSLQSFLFSSLPLFAYFIFYFSLSLSR